MRTSQAWVNLIVVGIVALAALPAAAVTVDLGTSNNAANWKFTGAGLTAATAFQVSSSSVPVNGNAISFSSNAFPTGTFRPGSSAASFNGFWFADLTFPLPANATNVSMHFNTLFADDRVELLLNGTKLGDFFLNGSLDNPPLTGAGVMSLPPGPPDQPFTFTGITTGTVTSGFAVGGNNVLRLVANNTNNHSLNAPTVGFQFSGDGVYSNVAATLTYDVDVPEPASLSLGVLGLLVLSGRRGARR